jgi:hypothetical protein
LKSLWDHWSFLNLEFWTLSPAFQSFQCFGFAS